MMSCFAANDVKDDTRQRAIPVTGDEDLDLAGPGWFPRWAPTSDLELYQAEAAILNPIRPMISQRTVAGLNTICSLHEKVRGPEKTVVEMHRTIPHGQTEVLSQLDADNYTSIVCVHGFAGGVANWLPVWRSFADQCDVYAIDLPGFARSIRPRDVLLNGPDAALAWYMESFLKWFDAMRIGEEANTREGDTKTNPSSPIPPPRCAGRRVVLVGHSFGGYLSAMFAARYPHVVDRLVLCDPWGVPRYVPPTKEDDPEGYRRRKSFRMRMFRWIFDNVGTSGCLLIAGPAGPRLLPRMRPDFGKSWATFVEDPNHFYAYTYHCNANGNRVGELAFKALGTSPIAAFYPLIGEVEAFVRASTRSAGEANLHGNLSRLPTTNRNTLETTPCPPVSPASSIPSRLSAVKVLFGAASWMFNESALKFVEQLRQSGAYPDAEVVIISQAGHQLMSDNPSEVAEAVLDTVFSCEKH